MRLLLRQPFVWLSLLAIAASRAEHLAPRTASYSNGTTTNQTTSSGPAPTGSSSTPCEANCTLNYGLFVEVLRYTQKEFDHTIKAADVTIVINNRTNTTRTITNLINLPSGYTRPPVDADGTAVWTVTTDYANNGTTILTFPTGYTQYDSSYNWTGVLATTSSDASLACETATADGITVTLPSHPQPGPITFPSDVSTYTKSPLNITFPPGGDKKGLYYTTSWDQIRESDFYQSVFPSEAAFQSCVWPLLPLPATAQSTAYLLTETHTSYENSAPTSTSDDGDGGFGGGIGGIHPNIAHTEFSIPIDDPIDGPTEDSASPTPPPGGATTTQPAPGGATGTSGTSGSGGSGSGDSGSGGSDGSGSGSDGGSGSGSGSDGGSSGGSGNSGSGSGATPGNTPATGPQATGGSGSGSGSGAGQSPTVTISGIAVSTDGSGHVIASGTTLTPGSTVFITPSTGGSAVPVAIQTSPSSGSGSGSGSASGTGSGGGEGSSGSGSSSGSPQPQAAHDGSSGSGSSNGETDTGSGGSSSGSGSGSGSEGSGSGSSNSGGNGGSSGSSSGNTILVVGGTTTTLSPAPGASGNAGSSSGQPIVVAGTTYYPTATAPGAASTDYIISGQTLEPGHPITLNSGSASPTVVALTTDASGNNILVVGGSTSTLVPTGGAIGGYIISGLTGPVESSLSAAEAASGSATITEAVLTVPGVSGAAGSSETLTAIEVAPGTWVVPGENGGAPRTISVGGAAITLSNGEVLSAASSGVVVGERGSSTTVAASTTVVTGTAGGVSQFTGDAVRLQGSDKQMMALILGGLVCFLGFAAI